MVGGEEGREDRRNRQHLVLSRLLLASCLAWELSTEM